MIENLNGVFNKEIIMTSNHTSVIGQFVEENWERFVEENWERFELKCEEMGEDPEKIFEIIQKEALS